MQSRWSSTTGLSFQIPSLCASKPRPNPSSSPSCPIREPLIPPGAIHLPARHGPTPIASRLSTLSFGYESKKGRPRGLPWSSSSCLTGPVRYLCPRGHVVTAQTGSPACTVCPTCAAAGLSPKCNPTRARLGLEALQAVAAARGGECLEKVYPGTRARARWRCAKGHEWSASLDNVRGKESWCPVCAKEQRRFGMADMHAMARARGGACLSARYENGTKKLLWRCAKGHEFWLAPNNMRRKEGGRRKSSWCSICATEERQKLRAREKATKSTTPAFPHTRTGRAVSRQRQKQRSQGDAVGKDSKQVGHTVAAC